MTPGESTCSPVYAGFCNNKCRVGVFISLCMSSERSNIYLDLVPAKTIGAAAKSCQHYAREAVSRAGLRDVCDVASAIPTLMYISRGAHSPERQSVFCVGPKLGAEVADYKR